MPERIDVRLKPDERAILAEIAAALSTPLRPTVTGADVLRAGLLALRERVAGERGAA